VWVIAPGIGRTDRLAKHSSPNHYGQSVNRRDAKDAKEAKCKTKRVFNPCKYLRCDWPVTLTQHRLHAIVFSLASPASLAVGGHW